MWPTRACRRIVYGRHPQYVRASVTGTHAPADAIGQANRLVCADSPQGLFVTLFYAQLDPLTGEVLYVNAGHTPAWLQRAGGEAWIELTRTGLPLGMFRHQALQQRPIRLEPGDLLFLYTDGVLDATDPQGQAFGVERLRLWAPAGFRPRHRLGARTGAHHISRGPLFDDITFVIVKRGGRGSRNQRPHFEHHGELNHLAAIRQANDRRPGRRPRPSMVVLAVDELTPTSSTMVIAANPRPLKLWRGGKVTHRGKVAG
jgi:hypothetical protein